MCAYIYIECALRTFLPFSFCACHHDSCIACDMRVATLVSPQQHPARWGSMPQGCILRARANQRFSKSAFGPPGPFCNTACPQNMPPNVCLSGGNLPLRVSLSLSLTLTLSLSPSLSPSLPPSLRPSLARSFCLLSLSLFLSPLLQQPCLLPAFPVSSRFHCSALRFRRPPGSPPSEASRSPRTSRFPAAVGATVGAPVGSVSILEIPFPVLRGSGVMRGGFS